LYIGDRVTNTRTSHNDIQIKSARGAAAGAGPVSGVGDGTTPQQLTSNMAMRHRASKGLCEGRMLERCAEAVIFTHRAAAFVLKLLRPPSWARGRRDRVTGVGVVASDRIRLRTARLVGRRAPGPGTHDHNSDGVEQRTTQRRDMPRPPPRARHRHLRTMHPTPRRILELYHVAKQHDQRDNAGVNARRRSRVPAAREYRLDARPRPRPQAEIASSRRRGRRCTSFS